MGGPTIEEDCVELHVAGIPDPWGKGDLRIAQYGGVTNVAVLQRGRCSKAKVVPSAAAVAKRENGVHEELVRSRVLLQTDEDVRGSDEKDGNAKLKIASTLPVRHESPMPSTPHPALYMS